MSRKVPSIISHLQGRQGLPSFLLAGLPVHCGPLQVVLFVHLWFRCKVVSTKDKHISSIQCKVASFKIIVSVKPWGGRWIRFWSQPGRSQCCPLWDGTWPSTGGEENQDIDNFRPKNKGPDDTWHPCLRYSFCLKEAHLGEESLGVAVHDVRVVLLQKTVHFLHLGICSLSRDIFDFSKINHLFSCEIFLWIYFDFQKLSPLQLWDLSIDFFYFQN